MNYRGRKAADGSHVLLFTLACLCIALSFILTGCSLPALFKGKAKNPHTNGECKLCHRAPLELLSMVERGGSDGGAQDEARALKSDLNGICTRCHEPGRGDHAIGKLPEINRNNLPLDEEGKITCAITCHDVHRKNIDDPLMSKGLLRHPQTELCLSCHDK